MSLLNNRTGDIKISTDLKDYKYISEVQGKLFREKDKITWKYEDKLIDYKRIVSPSKIKNVLDIFISLSFKSVKPNYIFISMTQTSLKDDPNEYYRSLVFHTVENTERYSVTDQDEVTHVPPSVSWISSMNRYFTLSILNLKNSPSGLLEPVTSRTSRISMSYPLKNNTFELPLKVYFGPKKIEILRNIDDSLINAVDLGWFKFLSYPILKFMRWLYGFVNNYGVCIIILTILLRILVYPLTYKSMKSMKRMSKLQPKLMELREKYKNDREKLNSEMLSFMRNEGYNPMSGCLPILVQMPIFFALYQVLSNAVELYQAPFVFWIKDLSEKDPYYIAPILVSVLMYAHQKIVPTTISDPTQKKIMQMMPLIFGMFMITLPSGLAIYMLVSTFSGIVQQFILNKQFDSENAKTS